MPSISLQILYTKGSKAVLSPRDLLDLYFYGINTRAKDGSTIPNHVYEAVIAAAQQEIEKYLAIKICPQVIEEDHHYHGSDWMNWGLIMTSYPVKDTIGLAGYYGDQKHLTVPKGWLKSKMSSDDLYHRSVWLIPNGTGQYSNAPLVLGGITPILSSDRTGVLPDYWRMRYVTGFDIMPMDLVNMVGKLAATNIFNLLGDLILGAGIASQSIGVDGLSQSISTTSSAENSGYSSRINMYIKELRTGLPRLKEHYTGIKFTVG